MCLVRELTIIMENLRVEHLMVDTQDFMLLPDNLKIALQVMGRMLQVWLWENMLEWHPKLMYTGMYIVQSIMYAYTYSV